jgi:hypothetical protein
MNSVLRPAWFVPFDELRAVRIYQRNFMVDPNEGGDRVATGHTPELPLEEIEKRQAATP